MLTDRYGLPVSTSSDEARDAYVAGCDCVLSAEYGAEANLARALEADPGFAVLVDSLPGHPETDEDGTIRPTRGHVRTLLVLILPGLTLFTHAVIFLAML